MENQTTGTMSGSDASDLTTATKALSEVVRNNGGFIHEGIEFKYDSEEGMGVFVNSPLSPTSAPIAIRIPFHLCISTDMVLRNDQLRPIFTENPGLLDYPDEVLCVGLMYTKLNPTVETEWSLHARTLPLSFNTTLYWTEEELNELKDSNVFHLTKMLKSQIAVDWSGIHEPLSLSHGTLLAGASIQDYCWALSVVYSRAIGIQRSGQYIRCITPCLDMANHSQAAGNEASDTIVYDPQNDSINLLVTHAYNENEELFAVYGEYSNAKLAHTYGFVVRDPHVVTIDLWSKVSPTTTFGPEKQTILNSHELTKFQAYDFSGTLRTGGVITAALLTTVRVLQLAEDELPLAERAYNPTVRMVSVRNEMAAYSSLKQLFLFKMRVENAEVIATEATVIVLFCAC
jgi:hypothetical protein